MWLQKLKKKKFQCFLIGMLIFLSALIFSTSLSLVTSIKGYVSKYYANDKYYDLILYSHGDRTKNKALNWCKSSSKVDSFKDIQGFMSGYDLYNKGTNLKVSSYDIFPIDDMEKLPFGLSKTGQLNNNKSPRKGEIWVSQLFEENYNVSLGDMLKFKVNNKTISLKVTAVINDSLHPSSMIGSIFLYTNKNSGEDFQGFNKLDLIFINPKKNIDVKNIGKSLISAIGNGTYSTDKDDLVLNATMTISMIGGAATLASLLIFVASVILIRFIMWNNILKEYKSIGIYKALGFSRKEILKFYIVGYSLIAIVTSIIGVLCSIPILNFTASKVLKYIGNFNSVSINFSVIIFTVVLFSLIVILNLYFVISRTNKISPVEALRAGVTSSRKKFTKSLIKDNCSPRALAINDIFKYKKISACITVSLTLALTLIILFSNLDFTISKMEQNLNVWFGIPKVDITISSSQSSPKQDIKNVLNYVKKDSRVKNYVYGSIETNGIVLDTKKYKIKSNDFAATTMNAYSDGLGFTVIKGHNPKDENEVAVSLNILKESGLSIGDYIELSVNNKKSSYIISGSYNSLWEDGYGLRILSSVAEKENPQFIYDTIFLNLKNANDNSSFEKNVNEKFPYVSAGSIDPTMKYAIKSIPGTIMPITYLLIIVFIIFAIVTILNIIVMNIRDNRRNFGIMKALGFTYKEIRNRLVYRIIFLTLASIILSIMLNMIFARSLIAFVIENLDVLIVSPSIMLVLLLTMFLLILIITFVCCTTINNAKPTELIEE